MVNIFIEAKNKNTPECEFLVAVLNHLGVSTDKYNVITTDGYTNLMDSVDASNILAMQVNTDAGGKNLVVFDADTVKNHGGFTMRKAELLGKRDELGLDFDLFLWPNNKEDGDVEVLMESIARKDLYPEFFVCFSKYENCLLKRKDSHGAPFYSAPNRKGKLFAFITSLPISKTKKRKTGKGVWLWDEADIWDLESDSLNPIKDFLSKYFI